MKYIVVSGGESNGDLPEVALPPGLYPVEKSGAVSMFHV